jgi:hypothetical protein
LSGNWLAKALTIDAVAANVAQMNGSQASIGS